MLRQETIRYLKSRRRAGLAARLGPARTPGKRQRQLGRARLFLAKDMDVGDAHVPTALGNEHPRRRSRKYPPLSLARLPDIAKRDFSAERRRHLAETGAAMPGGRFPIENTEDLRNAMRLLGHASDREAVVAHIKRRATAIGVPDPFAKIRKDWAQWDLEHPERHGVGEHLGRIGALGGTIYNAPRIARVIHGVLRARGYRKPARAGLAALGAYGAVRIGGEVGAYLGRKVDETSGRLFKADDEAREKVRRVLHEDTHGRLRSGSKRGPKVHSRAQAIAIALNQAGLSR